MEQAQDVGTARKPLWKRILDFPLVAMLIALALVIFCFTVAFLAGKYLVPPIAGLSLELKFDLIAIPLLLLAYKFVISRLGDPPRDDYRDTQALRHLGQGLGAGLLLFSAAVAVAAILGVYRITGEGTLNGLPAALLASAIFPAINEEMIFRGILFRWLEEFGGSWLALVLTSALFGAAHLMNPNASLIAAVGIALEAGVMLGAAYMLTRSLWLPMGLHAAWNFTQGEIYDIPVSGTPVNGVVEAQLTGPPLLSGNGFGLEGSLFGLVPATIFGVWMVYLAVKRGKLVQPIWIRRRAGRRG